MKNIKEAFASSKVRKVYRKARRKVLDKGKNVENRVINYLETEIAPRVHIVKFDNYAIEQEYYAKILVSKNVYYMLLEFDRNNLFLGDKDKAHKLLSISKIIDNKYSDVDSRYLLSSLALNLYEDYSTFGSYVWACIRSERYDEAAISINYLSSSDIADEKQVNSLKKALSTRLPMQDIDNYLKSYSRSRSKYKKMEIREEISRQKDQYQKLYSVQDYKAISDIVFDEFKDSTNVDSVTRFINLELKSVYGFSLQAIMLIMINTGKKFSAYGKREFEIALVEEAIKIKKYPMSVRAAFWAYYKQGDINKSREALDWLEEFAKIHQDKKQLKFVQEKRQTYLFIDKSNIKNLIESATQFTNENYKPVENNIAYILHNTLPYASGGYATRGHGLAEAIQEKGYNVTMVARPGFPLDIKKELMPSDIQLVQLIEGIKYTFMLEPRRDKTVVQDFITEAADQLFKKFIEIRPSVVIAASNHLTGLPALIAARRLGVPFIYEVRGFWEVTRISREPEFEHTEFYKILCELESIVASSADHVFTLTTPMQEELISRGVDTNKITILPNSCNPERFEPTSRNLNLAAKLKVPNHVPVIGYIGTFVQYEGLENLAEACGLLKQRGIEFRLLIVGNENTAGDEKGPITQSILEVAKQYGFENWLIMPGRVPHDEVEDYYSLVDIAPFPRKPQPVTEMVSPMKPLEAAAMKKAIVVSSVRALTDMIEDGKNGLVFEKGNVESLYEKLYQLIVDENLRIKLGEEARLWVEYDRTWTKTAQKFMTIVEKVLNNDIQTR